MLKLDSQVKGQPVFLCGSHSGPHILKGPPLAWKGVIKEPHKGKWSPKGKVWLLQKAGLPVADHFEPRKTGKEMKGGQRRASSRRLSSLSFSVVTWAPCRELPLETVWCG